MVMFSAVTYAEKVKISWPLGDTNANITGEGASHVSSKYAVGAYLSNKGTIARSLAEDGYSAVDYSPAFTTYGPSAKVSAKTAGHQVAFQVTPASGHTFKPTKVSFDAAKCGTDNGNVILSTKLSGGSETDVATVTPLRNKIGASNSTGYSHYEYRINNYNSNTPFLVLLYIENIATDKTMALRNVTIEGDTDSEIYDVSHYISTLTCQGNIGGGTQDVNLYTSVSNAKDGESIRFGQKLYGEPDNFTITLNEGLGDGYSVTNSYNAATHTLTIDIKYLGETEMTFSIVFSVTNRTPKGIATPLKRGLTAVNLSSSGSSGNLVSWRSRKSDGRNYKFKLYRGSNENSITTALNNGKYISGKTNFQDAGGTTSSFYRVEVYDVNDNIVETETCQAWSSQVKYIDLESGAPTDTWGRGATYTPNDASMCDMDGDGEYEIILKWSPSNEKDAASSGTTSPEYFACYKMDGTRLWILTGGPNMFSSAHTSSFVAWDLDGDGYGEFMIKTGHGAIDGEGNYLSVDNNSTGNYLSSNGKQTSGEEWITVFDGTTGAELKTIDYHTNYADGSSYWGDSKQNRSERYLAGIAWLDGENMNPSAIFSRGYYNGAFIGAYDWDGENLTLRWLHRAFSATSGEVKYANGTTKSINKTVYGEGCHWFSCADVDRDGKQEITFGSGALKPDGTTLYRTGLGHGDALHVSDFDPERPGLETFMVHEESPYGMDYRDGTTGQLLLHKTAGNDTGRGFMANFDPERDDALWQASAWGNIFDKNGNSIIDNKTWGGGAAAQDRLYWTGTLGDDFWGKGVLETWNSNTGNFDRITGCVNNGNYTYGNTNNASKQNACLLGDILGDWREEVMCWTEGGTTGYQLVINATKYTTDYTVPHLMDDIDYRAQLIAQNCCYNQPPHLGYNLRESKKITAETFDAASASTAPGNIGKYWGAIYVTYPVKIPEGVTAFSITDYTHNGNGIDTLKVTAIRAGEIVEANRAIVFNSSIQNPAFIPTSLAATANPSYLYVKGEYSDTQVSIADNESSYKFLYEFRDGERGVGFYKTENEQPVRGGAVYGLFGFSSEHPGEDSYVFGTNYNSSILPEPVYLENFESAYISDGTLSGVEGGTMNGTASIGTDDPRFSRYYQNMSGLTHQSTNTNYLSVTTNAFSKLFRRKALSISFWVNPYYANTQQELSPSYGLNQWSNMFVVMGSGTAINTDLPVAFNTRVNMAEYVNANYSPYYYYFDNDTNQGVEYLTSGETFADSWHNVTLTYSISDKNLISKRYIDGVLVQTETNVNAGTSGNSYTPISFLRQLTQYCIGGNDVILSHPDNALAYDEIAVYDLALTDSQVERIVADRLTHYDETVTAVTSLRSEPQTTSLSDGKYIIDNRLVIVRGGRTYDTNGRLISPR